MIHCSKGLMMRKNQILKHEISHAVAGWRQFYGNKKLEENSFNLVNNSTPKERRARRDFLINKNSTPDPLAHLGIFLTKTFISCQLCITGLLLDNL